jgi:dienelactone hydrolase
MMKELEMRFNIFFVLLFILSVGVQAESTQSSKIITEEVPYQVNNTEFTGYLAYDSSTDVKRPGILVVHEWWGLNDYACKRAEMLAELGYVAFAVDMYGDGKLAEHPEDAKMFMQEVISNIPNAEKRLITALHILQKQKMVNSSKIAAIGYCFGGGMVLHLARIGTDIDSVVSFHGSLVTQMPAKKDAVKARILVFNGEDDPFVPTEQVDTFKQEMQNAGAKFEFISYPNVKHSFTNPQADEFAEKFNMPALEYNQHADEDSWMRMQAFFDQIF